MILREFQEELLKTFVERFYAQYESKGVFVVCRTLDREEHKKSNKSMYSWYIKLCNAIYEIWDHWEYNIAEYNDIQVRDSEQARMIEDCKNSETSYNGHLKTYLFDNARRSNISGHQQRLSLFQRRRKFYFRSSRHVIGGRSRVG